MPISGCVVGGTKNKNKNKNNKNNETTCKARNVSKGKYFCIKKGEFSYKNINLCNSDGCTQESDCPAGYNCWGSVSYGD